MGKSGQSALISAQKINYLDHVKVGLTILVVLHHAFIAYGSPGFWPFRQPTTFAWALYPMTVFVFTNQSFFMGLFFLMSAYFIEPSLKRKGPGPFVSDRVKRLGIPLFFYSFVLNPWSMYVFEKAKNSELTFFAFLRHFDGWINFGVLWFVAALLIFTFLFVLADRLRLTGSRSLVLPAFPRIIVFAVALGVLTFFVRIFYPISRIWQPLGFQLAYFPQYIALFIIGILARRASALQKIDVRTARKCGLTALSMIVFIFPIFYFDDFLVPGFARSAGWMNLVRLFRTVTEQLIGICLIVWILGISRVKWNAESCFLRRLSRAAFAVYIFHPFVLVGLSFGLSNWPVEPLIKLFIVAPLAVTGSFLLGSLIVKIPCVNRII